MAEEWKQELIDTLELEVRLLTTTERNAIKFLGVDPREFVIAKIRRAMNAYSMDRATLSINEVCGDHTSNNTVIGCAGAVE